MLKNIILIFICFTMLPISNTGFASEFFESLPALKSTDRILIISPHPDDEILACSGLIKKSLKEGVPVKILYLTNGDDNEASSLIYKKRAIVTKRDTFKNGVLRKEEAINGMRELGLLKNDLIFLGYPDGGLMTLWRKYWSSKKPMKIFPSRISKVIYEDSPSFDKDYRAENLLTEIKKVIESYSPTIVFCPSLNDLHYDHQAATLFLRVALMDGAWDERKTKVFSYVTHEHTWPRPKGFRPQNQLSVPIHQTWYQDKKWVSLTLDNQMLEAKRRALFAHKSQMAYSKKFLLSFVRKNEIFYAYETEPKQALNAPVRWSLDNDYLTLSLSTPQLLDQGGSLSLDLFAHRPDKRFDEMPKLNIKVYSKSILIMDRNKKVIDSRVRSTALKDVIIVRIPADLLSGARTLFVFSNAIEKDFAGQRRFWMEFDLKST